MLRRRRNRDAEADVAQMFAAVSDLYAKYWHDYFHFALFDHADESWEDAFERTHRRYCSDLRAEQATNILVVACGRGRFARYLADETSAQVLGIDLSASQLSHALPFRGPNLHFEQSSVMDVEQFGRKFDAVVCLDAACYFPDKAGAVRALASVMDVGARLLVVDWCRREEITQLQEEVVLRPLMRYWAIPNLATASEYRRIFANNGLHVLKQDDLNELTARNWEFAYRRALDAVRDLSEESLPDLVWRGMKLGPHGIRLIKEQFPAALHIKAAFDLGYLRYVSTSAVKGGFA